MNFYALSLGQYEHVVSCEPGEKKSDLWDRNEKISFVWVWFLEIFIIYI